MIKFENKEPVIEFFEVQAIASMMYEICKRFEEKETNIHRTRNRRV